MSSKLKAALRTTRLGLIGPPALMIPAIKFAFPMLFSRLTQC
jgi:hypothetical protein